MQRPQAQPKAQRAQRSQQQQQQRVERRQREQKQSVERQQREQQKQAAPKQTDRPASQQALTPERSGPQQVNRIQASNDQRKGVRERLFASVALTLTKRDFRARWHRQPRPAPSSPLHHDAGHPSSRADLRRYSYLVVDDDICIVDPATYYVVDVIP